MSVSFVILRNVLFHRVILRICSTRQKEVSDIYLYYNFKLKLVRIFVYKISTKNTTCLVG